MPKPHSKVSSVLLCCLDDLMPKPHSKVSSVLLCYHGWMNISVVYVFHFLTKKSKILFFSKKNTND
jgi:hypothetical protein